MLSPNATPQVIQQSDAGPISSPTGNVDVPTYQPGGAVSQPTNSDIAPMQTGQQSGNAPYGRPADLNSGYSSYQQGMTNSNSHSKVTAGVLGLVLGSLGVHRFYLGYMNIGIIQVVATLLTCGIAGIWGTIEGILILLGQVITSDANGNPLE